MNTETMEMNAENRTNVNVSRAQVLRNIARTRHCSYCHQEGHTIRTCNDETLVNFENMCNVKKRELIIESQLNVNLSKISFRHWLLNYSVNNINIIKAYSISRCGTTLRDNLAVIIEKITNYVYGMLLEEGELDDLPPLIDSAEDSETDDYIPFQATQEVSENDVRLFMAISTMLNLNDNNMINPNLIQELYYSAIVQQYFNNKKPTNLKIISTAQNLTTEQIDEDLYSKCDCNICYDSFDKYKFVQLNCQHEFCKDCVIKTIKSSTDAYKEPCCAYCRNNIDTITTKSDEVKAELDYLFT